MFRQEESESDLGTGQIILRKFFTYATSSSFIEFRIFLFKQLKLFMDIYQFSGENLRRENLQIGK